MFAFPAVALSGALTFLRSTILPHLYFASAFFFIAILCISFGWGVGPGLLATFLSCAVLTYFYLVFLLHLGLLSFDTELLFQILPVAIAGVVVAIITGQREHARQRALQATKIAQDQAERLAEVNEELQEANQLKDFFLSVASHELKTPITTIRGQAQLALRRLSKRQASSPEAAGLHDIFTKVDEQTERLTNLVNDLLRLSSLQAGKLVLDIQPCNLNEICSKTVEEQHQLSKRPINLVLPAHLVDLRADATRLGQVMTNLIDNALKYSPAEGEVNVELETGQDFARIAVRDAGQGIPPEHLENIFKPFFRTEDARASMVSGTGLGLAICKEIIDQHQGRIWCKSSVGQGSTFFVKLPLNP